MFVAVTWTTTTTTDDDDQVLALKGKHAVKYKATVVIMVGDKRFHAKVAILVFKDTVYATLLTDVDEDDDSLPCLTNIIILNCIFLMLNKTS